jgi:hypothetical protein
MGYRLVFLLTYVSEAGCVAYSAFCPVVQVAIFLEVK